MNSRIAWLCLGSAVAAFSMDEYLPVQQGKFEVDLGYSLVRPTGFFDDDGKHQSWDDQGAPESFSPTVHGFEAQFKYGLAKGLDVEVALPFSASNKDIDLAGMGRPEVGLKYANSAWKGAGLYGNVALPLATGDYDAPGNGLALELGGVYQNRFGDFRLTGRASYTMNFEYDDATQGNVFSVLAKPEALWTEHIGTYLGVQLVLASGDKFGDLELDNGGYGLVVGPGLNVQVLDNVAYEISAPISVIGRNTGSLWGLGLQVYITLP